MSSARAAVLTQILIAVFLSFTFGAGGLHAALVLSIGQNFKASTLGVDSDALPPDANGAVGPAHFVEFINGRFAVFEKSTGRRVKTMADDAFWKASGLPITSNLSTSDPRTIFDAASQRWFALQIDFDNSTQVSNRFLLAVSTSADPTGKWTGFGIPADPIDGNFADFPTLGIDADGVYLSGDLFDASDTSIGPTLLVIPKRDLLAVPPSIAGLTSFGVLSYDVFGEILQPAVTSGAASTGEAVLAVANINNNLKSQNTLVKTSVTNAAVAGGAALAGSATLRVPSYTVPVNPPQPGNVKSLDDGDARISASVYRVGDMIYAVHGTEVNNRAAVQWFKIDAVSQSVLQSGRITGGSLDLYFASIAANENGTVVIACNGSSRTVFVSSYAVLGETVNGTLTFGGLVLLKSGTASFQDSDPTVSTSRWGDYSATSVDPADPNRFWTIQMIASGRTTWSTQVTELIAAPVLLNASLTGTNLTLVWPAAASNYQLQSSPSLGAGQTWTPVSQTTGAVGNQSIVSLPVSEQQGFFRLAQP
ncbi:MAG: hypothetical protein HY043_18490 [Verrucomicrobia bacterium]|nr:hypothetical protein [Verrucomicrobiota bacterium]